MIRILGRMVLVVVGLAGASFGALALGALMREPPTFDAPYPDLVASRDPAVIARGAYLVRGPGHCGECHADPAAHGAADAPLSGGRALRLPIATIHVPNITPDPETGIGRRSDRELARVLRHGVRPDGRVAIPFMALAHASDDDLVAILSYLRSIPPVRHAVPEHETNLAGAMVLAYLLEPTGPTRPVPRQAPTSIGIERGEYLVRSIASCTGCHTRVDHRTGERIGPELGGGLPMEATGRPGVTYVPPSLRPSPGTHRVVGYDEDAFVARFREGAKRRGTPMPWEWFARTSEDDLRSIHRYLASTPPSGEL